jgi:hypothetical protein
MIEEMFLRFRQASNAESHVHSAVEVPFVPSGGYGLAPARDSTPLVHAAAAQSSPSQTAGRGRRKPIPVAA